MNISSSKKPVVIHEIWEHNLDHEFSIIQNIVRNYTYVSIDTEYPGVVHHPIVKNNFSVAHLSPSHSYFLMKANVDALKIIQLGLTLSDSYGNLPHLGTNACFVWQFNFKKFDVEKDLSNPASIELLKQQGIDFLKNKQHGISAPQFAKLFYTCFARPARKFYYPMENLNFTWVTFHGSYDFAYLIKLLTQKELPNDLGNFISLLHFYFGALVYDLKVMLKFHGLHGGLKRMAEVLDVDRVAGNHHQAGSDSLLTMQMFMKMKEKYFHGNNFNKLNHFTYMLFGLNLNVVTKVFVPYVPRIVIDHMVDFI